LVNAQFSCFKAHVSFFKPTEPTFHPSHGQASANLHRSPAYKWSAAPARSAEPGPELLGGGKFQTWWLTQIIVVIGNEDVWWCKIAILKTIHHHQCNHLKNGRTIRVICSMVISTDHQDVLWEYHGKIIPQMRICWFKPLDLGVP
jgi:hypothetical protein